jgi:hypothetical protein
MMLGVLNLFLFYALSAQAHSAAYHEQLMVPLGAEQSELEAESVFQFSSTWQILGPFQLGTRGKNHTISPACSRFK